MGFDSFNRVLVILLASGLLALGLELDPDGGYRIVVGVDEQVRGEGDGDYITNIMGLIGNLSKRIFEATEHRFWIKEAEIVVPPYKALRYALTLNSFHTADIRIASEGNKVQVVNPNHCGIPGEYIQLSKENLGHNLKELLALWARFRWGCFEESGSKIDKRFPYALRGSDDQWVPNGCANVDSNELEGKFESSHGGTCDLEQEVFDSSCTYAPNPDQDIISSSIMNSILHPVHALEDFCNESTHQTMAPTPQNLFCDFKSVLETIRSSQDYRRIIGSPQEFQTPRVKVMKSARDIPPLFILIDNSVMHPMDGTVMGAIKLQLSRFLNDAKLPLVPTAMGTFPLSETNRNLELLVPFGLFPDNKARLVNALHNSHPFVNTTSVDFGLAILQAVAAIQKIHPENGGNILLLKTSGPGTSPSSISEAELLLQLAKANIKLFAIDITTLGLEQGNLSRVAEQILRVENAFEGEDKTIPFLEDVVSKLGMARRTSGSEFDVSNVLSWKGEVNPGTVYKIRVPKDTEILKLYFVTNEKWLQGSIMAGIVTQDFKLLMDFTVQHEFTPVGHIGFFKTRLVYSGVFNVPEPEKSSLDFVTFAFPGSEPGQLLVVSKILAARLPPDVQVEVFTSAKSDIVDFSQILNPTAPFLISARLTQGAALVTGASVRAYLQRENEDVTTVVHLKDDGSGTEDLFPGDGIYSGLFVPKIDGNYSLLLNVTKEEEIGNMPPGIMILIPSLSTIEFIKVEGFQGVTRVRDFKLETTATDFSATFQFTFPLAFGPLLVEEFRIFAAEDEESLILEDLNSPLAGALEPLLVHVVREEERLPGAMIKFSEAIPRDIDRYFAVAPWVSDGNYTTLSNAFLVKAGEQVSTTTSSSVGTSARTTTPETSSETLTGSSSASPRTTSDTPMPTTMKPGSTSADSTTVGVVTTTESLTDSTDTDATSTGSSSESTATTPEQTSSEPSVASTVSQPPKTSTPAPTNKPWIETGGGIATITILAVLAFVAVCIGGWCYFQRREIV